MNFKFRGRLIRYKANVRPVSLADGRERTARVPGMPTATPGPTPTPTIQPEPVFICASASGDTLANGTYALTGTQFYYKTQGEEYICFYNESLSAWRISDNFDEPIFGNDSTSFYVPLTGWVALPGYGVRNPGPVIVHQACPLPSATVTGTPMPTPTLSGATPQPTYTLSPTPTPSVTPSASPTPSVTPSASPTPTPSVTPTATITGTPEPTPSITPSATPTGTVTGTPEPTPEPTPEATPEATPSASQTPTPSVTPSASPTQTPSVTPTGTVTGTPQPTPTPTNIEGPAPWTHVIVLNNVEGVAYGALGDVSVSCDASLIGHIFYFKSVEGGSGFPSPYDTIITINGGAPVGLAAWPSNLTDASIGYRRSGVGVIGDGPESTGTMTNGGTVNFTI